jgi:antitoxin component of RelBE/YafQ-DinJ toxin-antitoxin module
MAQKWHNCAVPKTVLFRTWVDARRKKNVKRILAKVGLTPGQLVNRVFAQVELKNGLPFAVNAFATDDGHLPHVPNAETLAAIKEKAGRRFSSPESVMGHTGGGYLGPGGISAAPEK